VIFPAVLEHCRGMPAPIALQARPSIQALENSGGLYQDSEEW
jgi:hypothetical protein